MQMLRTLIVGMMLAATGAALPRYGMAQQATEESSERDVQEVRAIGGRGDRRDGFRPDDGQEGDDAAGGGNVNVQVVAAADERTNSVVVRGPAELLDLVADVLSALDSTTTQVADVRVYQLKYADAMNTADVINRLFGEEQSTSRDRDRGFFGPMMFRGPGGRGGQDGDQEANQATVVAAADSMTNTVVVAGPANILEVVSEVVQRLDAPVPDVADVKVFHLEYADAQDTAELINEIFADSSSSRSSRSSQQSQQVRFGFGGRSGGQQPQTGGGASAVEVVASADSRTNSVVVSGPPETLVIIAQVVEELDANPEQERRIFVYPLKNANATNLMEILNNLFAEMQALEQTAGQTGQQFQGGQRGGPGGQPASTSDSGDDLSDETYLEADADTNSLLVMTSSKNYEKIKPILDELDKPVGQVLIKVLFAEVTHSDSVDLGTEFSMLNIRRDGDFTETATVFGSPTQGLSVRTLEGELDVTLSALQEIGRLNVLSRPYILARNNQQATITVGEEVPIPTGTTTVAGQTQTTVEYRTDIGIVLGVTPSINPEGLVNMTVSPQITTRTGDKVAVSEDLEAETFATRSAETIVAVRDGQTIVIGGLIEDQITNTVRKVPLLGDIPIAGNLFKRTVKDKSKTELLIFLTPHVAPDALALTPISETVRQRSTLSEDETAAEIFKRHIEAMEAQPDSEATPPSP